MPMTVRATPLTCIVWPRADGLRANIDVHSLSLITATGDGRPGASSSAVNGRPTANLTPSTSKYDAVTSWAGTGRALCSPAATAADCPWIPARPVIVLSLGAMSR